MPAAGGRAACPCRDACAAPPAAGPDLRWCTCRLQPMLGSEAPGHLQDSVLLLFDLTGAWAMGGPVTRCLPRRRPRMHPAAPCALLQTDCSTRVRRLWQRRRRASSGATCTQSMQLCARSCWRTCCSRLARCASKVCGQAPAPAWHSGPMHTCSALLRWAGRQLRAARLLQTFWPACGAWQRRTPAGTPFSPLQTSRGRGAVLAAQGRPAGSEWARHA